MSVLDGIRGTLIDVDGTLLVHDEAVPGAAQALERLRARGIAVRLTTNTTRRPREAVAEALRRAGIPASTEDVLAPAYLARRRIVDSGRTRAMFLLPGDSRRDFEGVVVDEADPQWVVVGDLGPAFTWERLNEAFHALRRGASLLALHKNRAWIAGPKGLVLDAGPFVAALEYATGRTAEVVGKPSAEFFALAMGEMRLSPAETLVIGDDVETDGAGGASAGCRVAIVRTGHFRGASAAGLPGLEEAVVLDSIADLG